MQYGLTAKTIDRAHLKSVPNGTDTDWRFVWEVNYTEVNGRKLLIIVHADTRYAMIYSKVKPSVWKDLPGFLHSAVVDALSREGFTSEEIECYFQEAGEAVLTKTHGRMVTGGMIHLTTILPYYNKPFEETSFQARMTDLANEELCSIGVHPELRYLRPRKFFVEQMAHLIRR